MPDVKPLSDQRVLIFAGEASEVLELWYPKLRLEEAGVHVTLAGPAADTLYAGKHGYPCQTDAAIADMEAADFDGVVCPGGWMPDKLRRDPKVLELLREFDAGKTQSPRPPKRLATTEKAEARRALVDATYHLLTRFFRMGLLEEADLRALCDRIGTSIDPADLRRE